VAGFVGAPAMNFVDVTLDKANQNALAKLADGISIQTAVGSSQLTDGKYTFGIRSEDVRIVAAGQGNADGVVDVLERLGERTLIYARLGDGQQIVGSDAGNSRVAVGDKVGLSFDGTKSHLFDESGRAWHARGA
jgi:multiple sugar transport system ATP-binding protein